MLNKLECVLDYVWFDNYLYKSAIIGIYTIGGIIGSLVTMKHIVLFLLSLNFKLLLPFLLTGSFVSFLIFNYYYKKTDNGYNISTVVNDICDYLRMFSFAIMILFSIAFGLDIIGLF